MIKPIKLVDAAINARQRVTERLTTSMQPVTVNTKEIVHTSGELLRAYSGVGVKKLFASFPEFVESYKARLEGFKDILPEKLFNALAKASENNNFSLSKTVSEYYSGLNECHTFEQVKKLYPEITLPNLKFEEEITENLRNIVPKNLCDRISKLATIEEKQKVISDYFYKMISKQVENWEVYPEFRKLQQLVADEIISGKFAGKDIEALQCKVFNNRMPIVGRFLHTPDREEAYISMLREHYINGKSIEDISIQTTVGKEISAKVLRKNKQFPELDKNFRRFISNSEETARQFSQLSNLDTHQINSAIMTQTWTKSRLRADIGNATKFGKDWSIVKAVWQKTMFPETTFYPTDKLIDTYLLTLFKNGKKSDSANPIAKLLENPQLDKSKIMLLKRLYKESKTLDLDKRILSSDNYKEFKSKFDIENMAKAIESIEAHYKNTFFKRFWTDERKLRFTNALNQNREIAERNIELSEKILKDAMNNIFTDA